MFSRPCVDLSDLLCSFMAFYVLVWPFMVSKSLKILGFASDLQSFLDFSLQPLDRLESFSFSHRKLFSLYRTSFFLNKIPFSARDETKLIKEIYFHYFLVLQKAFRLLDHLLIPNCFQVYSTVENGNNEAPSERLREARNNSAYDG